MIPSPRLPRPRRPILLAILVTAVLAFPMGIVVASHQFSDVPNTNPFHNDIDALVDSGVTAGCGGGKYCPKSAVTREQMAAFLNRLGALAPGKTPVVNADAVDGFDANQLARADGAEGNPTGLPATQADQVIASATIVASTDGVVVVTASSTTGTAGAGACPCRSWSRINLGGSVLSEYYPTQLEGLSRNGSTGLTTTVAVAAGTHTFDLVMYYGTSGSALTADGAISAVFVPFTGSGAVAVAGLGAAPTDVARPDTE